MLIIPTIYLRNKQIVSPVPDSPSSLPTDPDQCATILRSAGVEMMQIVDLNIPPPGVPIIHEEVIRRFTKEFGLHCQLAGNIRSIDTVNHYLQSGVARIILGTLAYQKPDFAQQVVARFPGKVGAQIDVRGGRVVIKGWTVAANKSAAEYLDRFRDMGMTSVLYSDVDADGNLTAENFMSIRAFTEQARMPVIHNTDLQSVDELEQLLHLEKFGVMGTVVSKSIYEGRLDLSALVTMTKEHELALESDETTMAPE